MYSYWFIIFILIGYFIVTDFSVSQLFIIIGYWFKNQYEKVKWRVLHSPDNPIVRWKIHQNSLRIAKELMKEFDEKNKKK
jgi:hypothetical protein